MARRLAPQLRKTSIPALSIVVLLVLSSGVVHPNPTTTATGFSGRAIGVSVTIPSVAALTPAVALTLADTGPLPPQGGELDATVLTVNTQYAQADVLLSVTNGFDQTAKSEVAVADVTLLPGTANQVTAELVHSEAVATCSGVSGGSELVNLRVAGQTITLSGQPNQQYSIPGVLTLMINEQTSSSAGGTNSITVNALDLTTAAGIQVIVSSAHSDITCTTSTTTSTTSATTTATTTVTTTATTTVTTTATTTSTPPPAGKKDFMTGGGYITVNGYHANFGFVAGYKPGKTTPSGQLTYIDHGTGMRAKATSIENYYSPSPCSDPCTTRTFNGQAEVNGVSGYSFTVTATDNGEPGIGHDYFSITLTGPNSYYYSASGTLAGGNIELHT
jgi:hypothetical protein